MNDLLDHIFMSKELYQDILEPIREKYHISFSELIILLFLANHPGLDTATNIVEKRSLTKSAVSMSGRSLRERGLMTGEFTDGNHRSVHLKVSQKAEPIIQEARQAQKEYFNILVQDFSMEEKEDLKALLIKMNHNIQKYHNDQKVYHKKNNENE